MGWTFFNLQGSHRIIATLGGKLGTFAFWFDQESASIWGGSNPAKFKVPVRTLQWTALAERVGSCWQQTTGDFKNPESFQKLGFSWIIKKKQKRSNRLIWLKAWVISERHDHNWRHLEKNWHIPISHWKFWRYSTYQDSNQMRYCKRRLARRQGEQTTMKGGWMKVLYDPSTSWLVDA